MPCSSCNKQRADLHAQKSRLIPNQTLFLCNDCRKGKMEPRYIIIIAGRQPGGYTKVAEYIVNRKYVGADILAREIFSK